MLLGNFNGKIENTEMKVINTSEKCKCTIAWFDKSWSSVIDYAHVTEDLYVKLKSMVIEEDRYYAIGSDHNAWCWIIYT